MNTNKKYIKSSTQKNKLIFKNRDAELVVIDDTKLALKFSNIRKPYMLADFRSEKTAKVFIGFFKATMTGQEYICGAKKTVKNLIDCELIEGYIDRYYKRVIRKRQDGDNVFFTEQRVGEDEHICDTNRAHSIIADIKLWDALSAEQLQQWVARKDRECQNRQQQKPLSQQATGRK